jgi:hypothetical protein
MVILLPRHFFNGLCLPSGSKSYWRGSTSNKISYIEFIQQVKHLLFSYFDEIKSIKDVLFQYNYCIFNLL